MSIEIGPFQNTPQKGQSTYCKISPENSMDGNKTQSKQGHNTKPTRQLTYSSTNPHAN